MVTQSLRTESRDSMDISFFLVQDAELVEIDELTSDIEDGLASPVIDLRHGVVIEEDNELLVMSWSPAVLSDFLFNSGVYGLKEVVQHAFFDDRCQSEALLWAANIKTDLLRDSIPMTILHDFFAEGNSSQ